MSAGGDVRILVVDDDDAIRMLVTRLFQRRGYEVRSARDGVEAIELLDRATYDLMILDLMMPRVDGIGVIEHLAASSGPQPRIIVMTAAVPNILARVPPERIWKLITKPFDLDVLLQHADEALGAA
jgi:CheY-like chemotaxis protein